ncbi:MAG: PAS domain S-box protein [Ktedonobacteraceae bacterium]|nr:PAS domain S-box protein [Ktedonobacteraceae bacterium]
MADAEATEQSRTSALFPSHVNAVHLDQMLDILPDAILVVDLSGVITMANRQAESMFGYSRNELEGQSLEQLLPERFRQDHLTHRARYAAAPRTRPMGVGLQLFGLKKDGTEFPVDISLSPLTLQETPHVLASVRDISEQRRAERERVQQRQYIELQSELINQAHDAILVLDSIGRVLLWNQGAERLYGWTAQEAQGRLAHILLRARSPLSRSALEEHLEREGIWEGELVHTCRDGRTVLVESRQALVRNQEGHPQAVLEINRDITERRRREEAAQQSHARTVERLSFLQQVLDALPASVYLVAGLDARLVLANRSASQLWGAYWPANQPMREFLVNNLIEITDAQGKPLPAEQWATFRALRGESVTTYQEFIHRADGSSLLVLVNALPLGMYTPEIIAPDPATPPSDPQAVYAETRQEQEPVRLPLALVVHQDVSLLKEAEYLKDEFIGIAAHELRAPLAVLAGYADMLLVQTARGHGSALADWQQEALQEIKVATKRLTTLTEELLDVTRLQAGRLLLQRTPANLAPLLRQLVSGLQQTTTRHHMQLSLPETPLVAQVDIQRMEQILTNLIENAVKYSPRGGDISIVLREESIDGNRTACISVQDHGIGIPRHQQSQIFGRFMRADNVQAWGINGTGLGLYLSYQLVEQHGGQLWFVSEENKGSTFFVRLPLLEDEQQKEPSTAL